MTQTYIKLSEYARIKSITYKTAWNHYKKDLIENAFTDNTGHVLIPKQSENNNCVCYARVSSNDRKNSLMDQQKKLEEFANVKDLTIIKSVKEIASGMNDNRPKLNKLLEMNDWRYLVVENKDRLTRFGFNYIKVLLERLNVTVEIVNECTDDKEDIIQDFTSIITSFCARIYGYRRTKRKTESLIKELENDKK